MANFITDPTGTFFLSASWRGNTGKQDVNQVPPTPADASSSYWNAADANLMSGALKDLRSSAQDYQVLSASLSGLTTASFAGLSSTVHAVDVHVSGVDAHVSGVDPILSGVSSSLSGISAEITTLSSQLSQTVVDEQAVSGSLVSVSSSLVSYIAYTSASLGLIPPLSASVTNISNSMAAVQTEVASLSSSVFALNHAPGTGSIIVYIRTTGSDETGNGTSALPWRTLQHALLSLPPSIGLNRYYFDMTGISERMPFGYTLPACVGQSPRTATSGIADEPAGFVKVSSVKDTINIFAHPTVLTASMSSTAVASITGSPGGSSTPYANHIRYYFSGNLWPGASPTDPVTGSLVRCYIGASGAMDPPQPVAFNGYDSGSDQSYIDVPSSTGLGNPLTLYGQGATIYVSGTATAQFDTAEGNSALVINTPMRVQFAGIRFAAAESSYESPVSIRDADTVRFTNCSFDVGDPTNTGSDYNFDKFWHAAAHVWTAGTYVTFDRCHVNGVRNSAFGHVEMLNVVARIRPIAVVVGPNTPYGSKTGGPAYYDIRNIMMPTGPNDNYAAFTIDSDQTDGNVRGSHMIIRGLSHVNYSRMPGLTGTVQNSDAISFDCYAPESSIEVAGSDLDDFTVSIARGGKVVINGCSDNITAMAASGTVLSNIDPGGELAFTNWNYAYMTANWALGTTGPTGTLDSIANDTVTDQFRRVIWVTGTAFGGV